MFALEHISPKDTAWAWQVPTGQVSAEPDGLPERAVPWTGGHWMEGDCHSWFVLTASGELHQEAWPWEGGGGWAGKGSGHTQE